MPAGNAWQPLRVQLFAGEGGRFAALVNWELLRSNSWCVAHSAGPGKPWNPLWHAARDEFYPPSQLRPYSDLDSVCGVCLVLDGEVTQPLKERLGWHTPPSVFQLKSQISWLDKKANPSFPAVHHMAARLAATEYATR